MKIKLIIRGKDISWVVYKAVSLMHIVFAVYFGLVAYNIAADGYTFNQKTSFVIALIITILMIEKATEYLWKKNK